MNPSGFEVPAALAGLVTLGVSKMTSVALKAAAASVGEFVVAGSGGWYIWCKGVVLFGSQLRYTVALVADK